MRWPEPGLKPPEAGLRPPEARLRLPMPVEVARIAHVGWREAVAIAAAVALCCSCGGHPTARSHAADQKFLDSVYSQAPDVSSYRTSSQLVSLGQAICQDLNAGASLQTVGDRVPLVEGATQLPPSDLGVVIYASVDVFCPKYHKLLGLG